MFFRFIRINLYKELTMPINFQQSKMLLKDFKFKDLFIIQLGWNKTNIILDTINIDNISYSLKEDLNSNLFFIQQYDDKERIFSEIFRIDSRAGKHEIRKYINLLPNTTKLRFYFRMENYSNFINEISLNQLQINKIEK